MTNLTDLKMHKGVRLSAVTTAVLINASKEKAWDALSRFGDVSQFHAGVEQSTNHEGYNNKAAIGVERTCDILDGKRAIVLREKITEYEEGKFYRYEVFDWKNFPLKMMFFTFVLEQIDKNHSKLKNAYEEVPDQLKMYCGDMDTKDIPIRMVLYGKGEIENWSHYQIAKEEGVELQTINVPDAEE